MWASKTDMASLKTKKDERRIDNIYNVTADLKKLSNVVDNDVVRETVYDQLLIKLNAVDAKIPSNSRLVTKTQYDLDKQGLERKVKDVEKKITCTSGLVKKTDYATNIKKIENKILDTTDFIATSEFTKLAKTSFGVRM